MGKSKVRRPRNFDGHSGRSVRGCSGYERLTFKLMNQRSCQKTAVVQQPARVIPPSQRGYAVQAIRESGERGGLLLTAGTNFTAGYNREMGDAMELWNAHRWAE